MGGSRLARFASCLLGYGHDEESVANSARLVPRSARAERLLSNYGKLTPEMERLSKMLKDIPVDITPVYVAAGEK